MRGATETYCHRKHVPKVSIHAPRAGRDLRAEGQTDGRRGFNPRAPCGARRHPLRELPRHRRFNPRAPCGARLSSELILTTQNGFNPRAPCGARHNSLQMCCIHAVFQSTRPVRGATFQGTQGRANVIVSIHAPRAGRDRDHADLQRSAARFNPRAPCGARRLMLRMVRRGQRFQSTRPVRGATLMSAHLPAFAAFQSTRPVRGATSTMYGCGLSRTFQSTRPVRGATTTQQSMIDFLAVSIHAPRAGRDP